MDVKKSLRDSSWEQFCFCVLQGVLYQIRGQACRDETTSSTGLTGVLRLSCRAYLLNSGHTPCSGVARLANGGGGRGGEEPEGYGDRGVDGAGGDEGSDR